MTLNFRIYVILYLFFLTMDIMSMPTTQSISKQTNTTNATTKSGYKNSTSPILYIKHLEKYGYLRKYTFNPYSSKEIESALEKYQKYMQLPVTGKADSSTLSNMNKPRCGAKDIDNSNKLKMKMVFTDSGKRKRRQLYNSQCSGTCKFWYVINPLPTDFNIRRNVYFQLQHAFNLWASVANIVFIRGDNSPTYDIRISFYKGDHGDNEPFDGKGKNVAHASASKMIIHFDDEVNWDGDSIGGDAYRWVHPSSGLDFIQSAIHEIGHVFGMKHSANKDSVMFPTLQHHTPFTEYTLSDEDIKNVQNIYGICQPKKFDAIFSNKYRRGDGTYIIVGPYIYKFDNNKQTVEKGYPKFVKEVFKAPGIGHVYPDEVFWNNDYFMYWFVGDNYYALSITDTTTTSLHKIGKDDQNNVGWPGLREPYVDAALLIKEGSKEFPYVFRKDLVYKYNNDDYYNKDKLPFTNLFPGYPKKISEEFPGIPDNIDTAFTWEYDDRVYFFKDNLFYLWHPNDKAKTKQPYGIYQWKNVCNIYRCQIGPSSESRYECMSWETGKQ